MASDTAIPQKERTEAPGGPDEQKRRGGIPQWRLDEVTKARREAERKATLLTELVTTLEARCVLLEKIVFKLRTAKGNLNAR